MSQEHHFPWTPPIVTPPAPAAPVSGTASHIAVPPPVSSADAQGFRTEPTPDISAQSPPTESMEPVRPAESEVPALDSPIARPPVPSWEASSAPLTAEADSEITQTLPASPGKAARRRSASRFADDEPLALSPDASGTPDAPESPDGWTHASPRWRLRLPQLSKKSAIISGAALVVVALVVTFILIPKPWMQTATSDNSPTADSTQIDALTASLLQPGELNPITATSWKIVSSEESITDTSPRPQCVTSGNAKATPEALRQQVLEGNKNSDPVVLQQSQTYPDVAAATAAFTAISTELGACDPGPAYLQTGLAVSNLADQATGVVVALDTDYGYHTILVTRTGANVVIFDVADAQQSTTPAQVVETASPALLRLCIAGGKCPSNPTVSSTYPPASTPAGWLNPADLPRITPGTGQWTRIDGDLTSLAKTQSQCEGINLAQAAGPLNSAAKSLFIDDPAKPATFGVDMFVFTFSDSTKASTFSATLRTNLTGCQNRTRTATVTKPVAVTGAAAQGTKVNGFSLKVTQAESTTTKVNYRISVMTVGTSVVYLSESTSGSFDFTDAEWAAVSLRAGQRASQA